MQIQIVSPCQRYYSHNYITKVTKVTKETANSVRYRREEVDDKRGRETWALGKNKTNPTVYRGLFNIQVGKPSPKYVSIIIITY